MEQSCLHLDEFWEIHPFEAQYPDYIQEDMVNSWYCAIITININFNTVPEEEPVEPTAGSSVPGPPV